MIVMQYANNGSLLSYLNQNINELTWRMKLKHLERIANYLHDIHSAGLVHCALHGGNIVIDSTRFGAESFICELGPSRSVNSRQQNSTVRGVLSFIAPEVFHTRKYTQKSDVYSFGLIMYLVATGEPPFRDRQFDSNLICDIMGGLRPSMPDSAPEEYKKLAERCCDADPGMRPDAKTLFLSFGTLINIVGKDNSDDSVWNIIYHNDVTYTGDLLKPKNSYNLDSAADTC